MSSNEISLFILICGILINQIVQSFHIDDIKRAIESNNESDSDEVDDVL